MVFHYYFDIVAWIALIISAFSLIVTYRIAKKSNTEKVENYRFKIITKIKNYNIDLNLQIDRIETILKDHFSQKRYDSEERNFMNSTKDLLLPELKVVKDEINTYAKNITDYRSNKTMNCIRRIELGLINTERKYEILRSSIDQLDTYLMSKNSS